VLKYKKDPKLADRISRVSVHSTKKKLYRISRKMIGTQVPQNFQLLSVAVFRLPSSRQRLSNDDCPQDKTEDYRSVLCCIVYDRWSQCYAYIWAVIKDGCWFRFMFRFPLDLSLVLPVLFPLWFCVGCFCCVRFSFFSTNWRTPPEWPFCVEWDLKHILNQSRTAN